MGEKDATQHFALRYIEGAWIASPIQDLRIGDIFKPVDRDGFDVGVDGDNVCVAVSMPCPPSPSRPIWNIDVIFAGNLAAALSYTVARRAIAERRKYAPIGDPNPSSKRLKKIGWFNRFHS